MGTRSFPGVKSGRGVSLTPHPLLVPWSWKSRAIPLLPLRAVRPVQSLSACTRVTFTFFYSSLDSRRTESTEGKQPLDIWTRYKILLWYTFETAQYPSVQPYHLHVPIVFKSGSLNLLEPSGPVQPCNGIALPLLPDTTSSCTVVSYRTVQFSRRRRWRFQHSGMLCCLVWWVFRDVSNDRTLLMFIVMLNLSPNYRVSLPISLVPSR